MWYLEHDTFIDTETGHKLVWNNQMGWVLDEPTFFSEDESKSFVLIPEGSHWRKTD